MGYKNVYIHLRSKEITSTKHKSFLSVMASSLYKTHIFFVCFAFFPFQK